jgi:hypothetical protein
MDQPLERPTAPPTEPGHNASPAGVNRRCHICGYRLQGLPAAGVCPECGSTYTPESAQRLKPWPSAAVVALRLGWPIIGLFASLALGQNVRSSGLMVVFLSIGFVVAIPVNSWIVVHRLLKRSMPENIRTRGPVAVMRAIGITLCVLALLLLTLPVVLAVGCLMMSVR